VTSLNPLASELSEFEAQWEAIWSDDDLDRRRQRRDELIVWKARICAEDEKPLVEALRFRGFGGSSVWDLVNTRAAYPELIDTLRNHALRDYLPPTLEGIFRALTVRESDGEVFSTLVSEWRKGVGRNDRFLRWALANAISHIARTTDQRDELVTLIDGEEYSDEPFIRRLRKSKRGRELLSARENRKAA